MAKLKVYRTAIGFHDAYVAASSQKAALDAWGSDKNLFAREAAELVTDPALTKEPLAVPGKVIKRLRGTVDEQMAALPPDGPRNADPKRNHQSPSKKSTLPKPKPMLPPSRAELEKVEAALEDMLAREREQLAELAEREAALSRERRRLLDRHQQDSEKLTRARDEAADTYDRAVRKWRAG